MSVKRTISKIESIKFENIEFTFPGHDRLIEDCSVDFPTNKNIHLAGSSGVGKSTVLRMLAGIVSPQKGKILFNDQDVVPMSFEDFLPYRLNIGYSFDMGGLLSNRTLFENMMLPLLYHELMDVNEATKRVEEVMREFCIYQNRNLRPSSVSGGQRKACCVARAFVTHPEMLVLDQPTIGLDKIAAEALVEHIQAGRRDGWLKHCFIVSQDNNFANTLDCESYVIFDRKVFSYQQFEKKVIFA